MRHFAAALTTLLSLLFTIHPVMATEMFTESSFSRIRFLEGRWRGTGPDGKAFFEEYVLETPTLFRSNRYADGSYAKRTDGSTVALEQGVVTSTWGEFTWKATTLSDTKACFEPVNAPSSFCWERTAADEVTVTQRWTGEDGKAQSFAITLKRLAPG